MDKFSLEKVNLKENSIDMKLRIFLVIIMFSRFVICLLTFVNWSVNRFVIRLLVVAILLLTWMVVLGRFVSFLFISPWMVFHSSSVLCLWFQSSSRGLGVWSRVLSCIAVYFLRGLCSVREVYYHEG